MKPAHVPGTSLGSLYDMQIRVPNITGQFQAESWNITGRQGAFYIRKKSLGGASGSDGEAHEVSLDASYSSSVYGRSSTVQPSALRLIPCIKI